MSPPTATRTGAAACARRRRATPRGGEPPKPPRRRQTRVRAPPALAGPAPGAVDFSGLGESFPDGRRARRPASTEPVRRAGETGRITRGARPYDKHPGVAASRHGAEATTTKKGFLKPKPQRNLSCLTSWPRRRRRRGTSRLRRSLRSSSRCAAATGSGKVRKKRLSSLKKRILLERQEKYYQAHRRCVLQHQ